MGTLYTDLDQFPNQITVIDDSVDPPTGATFNTAPEALANRTRNLYNNTMVNTTSPLTSPSALTGIVAPTPYMTRVVQGYGTYIYLANATDLIDGTWVVQVNGNPPNGRWQHIENAQQYQRLIQRISGSVAANVVLDTSSPSSWGSLSLAFDPLSRIGSTPICCTSNTAPPVLGVVYNGDVLHITWNTIFYVQVDSVNAPGESYSDAAFGIFARNSSFISFMGGVWPGVAYGTNNPTIPLGPTIGGNGGPTYVTPGGTSDVVFNTGTGAQSTSGLGFFMIASYVSHKLGVVVPGSQFTVSQYRYVVP